MPLLEQQNKMMTEALVSANIQREEYLQIIHLTEEQYDLLQQDYTLEIEKVHSSVI